MKALSEGIYDYFSFYKGVRVGEKPEKEREGEREKRVIVVF